MTDEPHVDADSDLGFEPAVADSSFQPKRERVAGGASKRRGGLRRRVTGFAVVVGALAIAGGGYALVAPSSSATDTASSAQDIEAGRQLYETSCITCHGGNLQGVNGNGPSLVGVGSAAVYFQVSTGRMPANQQGADNPGRVAKFTEKQTRQIAAFVQSKGGGPEVPAPGTKLEASDSDLASGGELFRLNCASCHGATGAGAPLSAGKVAPSLRKASDTQLYTAMLSGPENMPVFSNNQITPTQKTEIIAYVKYLQNSHDPGGSGLDRIGPVSEGLVIWTIGLGVLIVAILWIGAKS